MSVTLVLHTRPERKDVVQGFGLGSPAKKIGASSHRGRPKNYYSKQEAGVQAASGPETLGLLLSAAMLSRISGVAMERRPLGSGVKAQGLARAGQTTTYMILAVQYLLDTEEIWLRPDMVMG